MADFTSTFFLYREKTDGGIEILRCKSLDDAVELPGEIEGRPVTELGAYAFSAGEKYPKDGIWTGTEAERDGVPELFGEGLKRIHLPAGLQRVGAYAFYNCWNLEELYFSSSTYDWGAGAFTGCGKVKLLDVEMVAGKKSGFKDVLSELRQTLLAVCHGDQEARLIFPEFYEESVENTPARILETHMHGCGHQYRYCFRDSQFQFETYDSLFPYVKAQEPEELVVRLASLRLRYPGGLTKGYEKIYKEYVREHRETAAYDAVRTRDMEYLTWLTDTFHYEREELIRVMDAAAREGGTAVISRLMELLNRPASLNGTEKVAVPKRKRFEL